MVEPTHLKNMLVKLDHLPTNRGRNKKNIFELPPPRDSLKAQRMPAGWTENDLLIFRRDTFFVGNDHPPYSIGVYIPIIRIPYYPPEV